MGDGLPFRLGTRDSAFHQYQQAVATGLLFLPAAGNRNDSNLNNAGSNGNYWYQEARYTLWHSQVGELYPEGEPEL